jgi:hypothetical protein
MGLSLVSVFIFHRIKTENFLHLVLLSWISQTLAVYIGLLATFLANDLIKHHRYNNETTAYASVGMIALMLWIGVGIKIDDALPKEAAHNHTPRLHVG